jgi:hypothetical protein
VSRHIELGLSGVDGMVVGLRLVGPLLHKPMWVPVSAALPEPQKNALARQTGIRLSVACPRNKSGSLWGTLSGGL